MATMKFTSWNIENLDKLMKPGIDQGSKKRLENIAREVSEIDPDVLCVLEGPKGEAAIKKFAKNALNDSLVPVLAPDKAYATSGSQWVWFLVKPSLKESASLLPTSVYDDFAGKSWKVHYWGDFQEETHNHYRHPQVLILDLLDARVECIGLHLKSKFVRGGESDWNAGGERRNSFIQKATKARIKLTTEAVNVRNYIDRKFQQVKSPAIFVMGDLNDGPGKEYFERHYLFFDLMSNIQGDVFFAHRFLNHALFDFPEDLRWSVHFDDFVDPLRDPHILLDHILFTQPLVSGALPLKIEQGAGKVEHEVHELMNAGAPSKQVTSDHRPVSVVATTNE